KDIQYLLDIEAEDELLIDILALWDDREKLVKHGVSYKENS
ncbi:type I-E CRISPR-associated endonuclease Cas1, partial [Streptococcus mutans]|nr:type I-E CRISPR-associated endonuclease Cas1 [Streptococcus mutans]